MGKKTGKPAYPVQQTSSYPVQPQPAPGYGAPPPPGYAEAPPPYAPVGAYPQPYPQPMYGSQPFAPPAYGAPGANPGLGMGAGMMLGAGLATGNDMAVGAGLVMGAAMMQQQQQPNYGQPAPVPQSNYGFPGQGPVVVRDAFDAGARFDGSSQPNIPPPPPGCFPNAAQMASASGRPVVLHQQKTDFLTGGTGGGYALI